MVIGDNYKYRSVTGNFMYLNKTQISFFKVFLICLKAVKGWVMAAEGHCRGTLTASLPDAQDPWRLHRAGANSRALRHP